MDAPKARYPFNHATDIQIRFLDVDMIGHVNNTAYLQYVDTAKYCYFKALMGEHFDMRTLAMVIASINIDFYAPTFMDEHIQVLTAADTLGHKSLVLEQRIVRVPDGQVKAICRTTLVSIDPRTMQSAPIQQRWRERLQEVDPHIEIKD